MGSSSSSIACCDALVQTSAAYLQAPLAEQPHRGDLQTLLGAAVQTCPVQLSIGIASLHRLFSIYIDHL